MILFNIYVHRKDDHFMLGILQQSLFTVCVERNPDGTYTFVGLVNEEGLSEGNRVELKVKEPSGLFRNLISTSLDEFRYFEMKQIQINNEDFPQLYFGVTGQNIEEKVEFTEE